MKIPDILNLCIMHGISTTNCYTESSYDISSGHSSVIVIMNIKLTNEATQPTLPKKHQLEYIQKQFAADLNLKLRLNDKENVNIAAQSSQA